MSEKSCLARLAELTGELELLMMDNEVLKKENKDLKMVLVSLKDENKDYRDRLNKCGIALEVCGGTHGE